MSGYRRPKPRRFTRTDSRALFTVGGSALSFLVIIGCCCGGFGRVSEPTNNIEANNWVDPNQAAVKKAYEGDADHYVPPPPESIMDQESRRTDAKPVETNNNEPTENLVPYGATAQCRDGTYSYSSHRRGTCSHHGGVARWL